MVDFFRHVFVYGSQVTPTRGWSLTTYRCIFFRGTTTSVLLSLQSNTQNPRENTNGYILATVEGYEFNPIPIFGLSEENGREEKRIRGKEKYRPK